METAIISIVSVALIILATVTMTMSAFQSASAISDSWKQMEQEASEIRRTEIAAAPPGGYGGGNIDLMVGNEGQICLTDFARWDVIAQRQGSTTSYLTYTTGGVPGSNEWTVEGLYLSSNTTITEVFDLNILDPGETMKMVVNLEPEIGAGETGRITVATPNGVTSQCLVTRAE